MASAGGSRLYTWLTAGRSRPRAAAGVASSSVVRLSLWTAAWAQGCGLGPPSGTWRQLAEGWLPGALGVEEGSQGLAEARAASSLFWVSRTQPHEAWH